MSNLTSVNFANFDAKNLTKLSSVMAYFGNPTFFNLIFR